MAYENIRFYLPHLAVVDGYYYSIDTQQYIFSQKASNGSTSFQYPINISNSFIDYSADIASCLQYDGFDFWSLQNLSNNTGIIIRRWRIINFICELISQFVFTNQSGTNKYNSSTFSIECYNTSLLQNANDGDTVIYLKEFTEFAVLPGTVIGIGYNNKLEREQVIVQEIVDDYIIITPLKYNYNAEDPVSIISSIVIFNNYSQYHTNIGAMLSLNPTSGVLLSIANDVEYFNITSSKFCRLKNVLHNYPDVFTLAYTKDTTLKLRDMRDFYRYKATIKGSDNFEGSNSSLPDDDKWVISSGDPYILNNSLFCSTLGGGHDEIYSSYVLINDFDVQIKCTTSGITTYSGTDIHKFFKSYFGFYFKNEDLNITYGLRNDSSYYNDLNNSNLSLFTEFNNSIIDSSSNGLIYNITTSPTFDIGMDATISGSAVFSSNSSINITNTSVLEIGKNNADFSILFWLKLNTTYDSTIHNIIQKGSTTIDRTPCILALSGSNSLFFGVSTTVNSTQGITVSNTPINIWILISFIKKDNMLYVYYDKVLKGTLTLNGSVINTTAPFYIGNNILYTSKSFSIDNLKVFTRAVSFYEIKDNYELYTQFFSNINNTTGFYSCINNSLINFLPTLSGINSYEFMLKASRVSSVLTLAYSTTISGGSLSDWYNLTTVSGLTSPECYTFLGLHSASISVTSTYFNDLMFSSGYLRYPLNSAMYYGTMLMDNIKTDQSSIIKIYDIDIEGDNLYRLQKEATYYGNNYIWSTYNFQVSPIRSFIDFITVDASTHVLPATGRNTAKIYSVTLDQYGQGVFNRPVTFSDDDPIGFVTTKVVYTDPFYNTGKADTGYTSGTSLRTVKITASVTQED